MKQPGNNGHREAGERQRGGEAQLRPWW
jgi:hypothetical protein